MPDLTELVKTEYPNLFGPEPPVGPNVVQVKVGDQLFYKMVFQGEVLLPDWLDFKGAMSAHDMLKSGTATVDNGTIRWVMI